MKTTCYAILIGLFFMNPVFAQDKKVAVVTFYVDKYINADKIDESVRAQTYEKTKEDSPDFDLRPILKEFHKTFYKDYAKKFPFDLVDEEKVQQHPKYLEYNGMGGVEDQDSVDMYEEAIRDRFIAIDGYKVIPSGGNVLRSWRTEAHMVERLKDLDIDGVMFVYLYFGWEPKIALGGLGNMGIRAYIEMDLFDMEAKKVFKLDEYATSKKSVPLAAGIPVMNYSKLLPMAENATEELLKDLEKTLPKLLKKVDKKL